jgi:hypothetical protein
MVFCVLIQSNFFFMVQPYFNYALSKISISLVTEFCRLESYNNNPPLDAENSNLFTYRFLPKAWGFDDGRFKLLLLEIRGQWQPGGKLDTLKLKWYLEASGGIAGNSGTQDSDPGRFGVATEGYFTFTVNFSSNTIRWML